MIVVIAASASAVAPFSAWLPGLIGAGGVLAGAALTSWLTYLRDSKLKRSEQEHALVVRAQDRDFAKHEEQAERVRAAYLGLLAAVHDTAARHALWDAEHDPSSKRVSTFTFGELSTALATVQMTVPEQEASKLQDIIDRYTQTYFAAGTPTRQEILAVYRSRGVSERA